MKSSKWMNEWITGQTSGEPAPCTRVSTCRISQSMAQHGWSIPCPCGFNRGELVLLPCSFGVCRREKQKRKKKGGFLLQHFSRSNMQCNNRVQSKKQHLIVCLECVTTGVQSKKPHLIVCLECVTIKCSQKSHTWFVCPECMSKHFPP